MSDKSFGDFITEFRDLIDDAGNGLSPEEFAELLDEMTSEIDERKPDGE